MWEGVFYREGMRLVLSITKKGPLITELGIGADSVKAWVEQTPPESHYFALVATICVIVLLF